MNIIYIIETSWSIIIYSPYEFGIVRSAGTIGNRFEADKWKQLRGLGQSLPFITAV